MSADSGTMTKSPMNELERLEAWLKASPNRMMDEVLFGGGDDFSVYLSDNWEVGFYGRGKTLAEAITKALKLAEELDA